MNYFQDVVSFLEAWNWPLIIAYICSGPFLLWPRAGNQEKPKVRELGRYSVYDGGIILHPYHSSSLVNESRLSEYDSYFCARYVRLYPSGLSVD